MSARRVRPSRPHSFMCALPSPLFQLMSSKHTIARDYRGRSITLQKVRAHVPVETYTIKVGNIEGGQGGARPPVRSPRPPPPSSVCSVSPLLVLLFPGVGIGSSRRSGALTGHQALSIDKRIGFLHATRRPSSPSPFSQSSVVTRQCRYPCKPRRTFHPRNCPPFPSQHNHYRFLFPTRRLDITSQYHTCRHVHTKRRTSSGLLQGEQFIVPHQNVRGTAMCEGISSTPFSNLILPTFHTRAGPRLLRVLSAVPQGTRYDTSIAPTSPSPGFLYAHFDSILLVIAKAADHEHC